jgi:hypothetical protein
MKTRKTLGLTLALCFLASAACFAADPQMGTWKLNEAKSKIPRGMGKNNTVIYSSFLGTIKVTVDGTLANGKPGHNEWKGKFDGKYYPVKGDPTADARAYKKVNANTLDISMQKGGKVTATGRIVVSTDGKSRTITVMGKDAKGRKFKSVGVYDKA